MAAKQKLPRMRPMEMNNIYIWATTSTLASLHTCLRGPSARTYQHRFPTPTYHDRCLHPLAASNHS